MNPFKTTSPKFFPTLQNEQISSALSSQTSQANQAIQTTQKTKPPFKKLRGGFLIVLGYALSPLCWWNDLVFNLPIAYGFGYLCHLVSPNFLIPGAIVGYWLSNVVGILLMQAGFLDVVQGQTGDRNLKKELLTGVLSSTLYTGVIMLLLQFKILETPLLSFRP